MIAALLFTATGSFDAGGVCEGHVRSGAADVRVDAAQDFGPMLYPVRRRSLNGRGIGVAIGPGTEVSRHNERENSRRRRKAYG